SPPGAASTVSRTRSKQSTSAPSQSNPLHASNAIEKPEAREPEPGEPSSAAAVASSDTQVEAREIARAERMLSSNPAGALAILRGARARFKPSFLPEERDYVE